MAKKAGKWGWRAEKGVGRDLLLFLMFSKHFFKPQDVEPTAEFVSAFMEVGALDESQVLVEIGTVVCDVAVGSLKPSGASVHVQDAQLFQSFLHLFIESLADAFLPFPHFYVDGGLYGSVVGWPPFEGVGIDITQTCRGRECPFCRIATI